MSVARLDHLYRETRAWEESTAWWTTLGFSFLESWGEAPHRAGILSRGDMRVVLAEVRDERVPNQSVFIATDDLEDIATRSSADIIETHWGTRMVTVTDPDGRTYNFEPGGDA